MSSTILEYDSSPSPRKISWRAAHRALRLVVPLIAVEAGSAVLAYYTLGATESWYYAAAIVVGNGIVLAVMFAHARLARIAFLLLAVLIVPYQLLLGVRWWRCHHEAERIIDYATRVHLANADYPVDLSHYVPRDPHAFRFITYNARDRALPGLGCVVYYHLTSRSVSHWWNPRDGWRYHPD